MPKIFFTTTDLKFDTDDVENNQQPDSQSVTPNIVKQELQRFNVNIPKELHHRIKIQAVKSGITMNSLAIKLFEDYLDKVQKEGQQFSL